MLPNKEPSGPYQEWNTIANDAAQRDIAYFLSKAVNAIRAEDEF